MDEKGKKTYGRIRKILQRKMDENEALDRLIKIIADRSKESRTKTQAEHPPSSS